MGKNKIIVPVEMQDNQLDTFFRVLGFEATNDFKEEDREDYLFIVDNNSSIQTAPNVPRLTTNIDFFLNGTYHKNVWGNLNLNNIDSALVQKVIKKVITQKENFNFFREFSNDFKEVNSIKIHELLNIGYFIDLIVILAHRENFDFRNIRMFLNFIFDNIVTHMIKEVYNPIEILYSFTKDFFIIELINDDYLFKMSNVFELEFEKYKTLAQNSNFLSINFFKKRSQVTLTSVWYKEDYCKRSHSCFFSETEKRDDLWFGNLPFKVSLCIDNEYDIENEGQISAEAFERRNNYIAKKITSFILQKNQYEYNQNPNIKKPIQNIDHYLDIYPSKKTLRYVNEIVKEKILVFLNNEFNKNDFEDVSNINMTNTQDKNPQNKTDKSQEIGQLKQELEKILAGKKTN